MLKSISLAITLGLFCLPGVAQSAAKPDASANAPSHGDVAAGYSYLDLSNSGTSQSFNGASFSGAYNITHWLAAAADFDYAHANVNGVGVSIKSYTFGPRIFYRAGRFTPFGEFLLGDATASLSQNVVSNSDNYFAFNMLGGTDIALNQKGSFAVRPEVAYLHVNSTPGTNGVHIGAGLAYHF